MGTSRLRSKKNSFVRLKWGTSNSQGFTLIELMISISIIGIAFVVVLTALSAVQRAARDGQRQSDINTIRGALQQYYSDNESYPVGSSLTVGILNINSKAYLGRIPQDPNGSSYGYQSTDAIGMTCSSNCQGYCLYANLETTSPPASSSNCSNRRYNYSVSQQ